MWILAAHPNPEDEPPETQLAQGRNLERLALFDSFDAAVAQARAIAPRTITPFTETRKGRPHLCIPDGLGYPVTAEPMGDAMRG